MTLRDDLTDRVFDEDLNIFTFQVPQAVSDSLSHL